eukprot:TRINITY_DN2885_c1_g1::TRINITY_DN2885_c1_g1_i2::g.5407::m.5407 TRINITY_DN2885_c1_g1::TRINITY_DN2885_c1_g1_i2::g.5407  ORF type:complete len:123 (-),score=11.40 TRINITY_DN2885_c1_g1_i2:171-539(-)
MGYLIVMSRITFYKSHFHMEHKEHIITPFLLETFGCLGHTARTFLQTIARSSTTPTVPYSIAVHRLYERVSVELQRSNASIVTSFYAILPLRGIAADKGDGVTPRPIGIGEVFLQMASGTSF